MYIKLNKIIKLLPLMLFHIPLSKDKLKKKKTYLIGKDTGNI